MCSWLANLERALKAAGGNYFAGGKVRVLIFCVVCFAFMLVTRFLYVSHNGCDKGSFYTLLAACAWVSVLMNLDVARYVFFYQVVYETILVLCFAVCKHDILG